MEQFNISKVIEKYKPDIDILAKLMFPNVKYPKQAFDRVLKGEAQLNSKQLEDLASYLGILVVDLFASTSWKSFNEDGCMCFSKGEYKAKLNYKGVYMTLYKNNEVIEQRVANIPDMKVQEFIEFLDEIISEYEHKSK